MDSESLEYTSPETIGLENLDASGGTQLGPQSTLGFLQAILPKQGIYFLVLFNEGYSAPVHRAYTSLEKMAAAIEGVAGTESVSVYHACGGYLHPSVEVEENGKTKTKYRVASNQGWAKSFWVDIDCGQEKFDKGQGYLTKRDAAVAIFQFSDMIGWPRPMIVDSGNGLHAYWPLTKDIAHDKWVKVAKGLKATLHHCGVIADPTRTADFASILRPAGSTNRKNGDAKTVAVKHAGTPSEPDVLASVLNEFIVMHGVGLAKAGPDQTSSSGLNDDLVSHLKGSEGHESLDVVRSALRYLDPGMSRDQWRTVVWAIRHGLGDTPEALELADQWSKGGLQPDVNSPCNYSGRPDVEQVWNSYDSKHPDRVTSASVFKLAADKGWRNPRHTASGSSQSEAFSASGSNTKSESSGTFKLADGDVHISKSPPFKRNYVMANVVTAGTYSVLAGSGGTLKTTLMLIAAASMAVGQDFGDLQIAQGAAMLFLGEEDHAEVSRRLSAVCMYYGFDPSVVSKLVKVFPAAGVDLRLTRNKDGSLCASDLVQNVIELAQQQVQACGDGVRLIVFDHARLVMDGDPDHAADVTQLTRVLTNVAQATGAAVILLAHSPKSVLKQQAKEMSIADVAGSSAFSDNARSGFVMYGMREDDARELKIPDADRNRYMKLKCAKANYGPQGTEWWFEKVTLDDWQVQVLKPVSLITPLSQPGKAKQLLRQRILAYLTQKPGRSKRQLRDVSGRNKYLGASEKDVLDATDALLEDGSLELRKPTPAECAKHRLPRGRELLFVAPIQP